MSNLFLTDKVFNMAENICRLLWTGKMTENMLGGGGCSEDGRTIEGGKGL